MSFLVGYLALAWREPTQTPPGGNVPTPLNVGIATQLKDGALVIGANPRLTTGLIVQHGNVGIGTTAPGALLHVADQFAAGGRNLMIGDDTFLSDIDVANTLGIYGNQNSTQGHIRLGSAGPVISGVGGNVGIGTTAPGAKLDVFDGDIIVGRPQAIHGTTHRQFILHGAWNNLYIAPRNDANTGWLWDRFVIKSGGNVGIGTTAPRARLEVAGQIKITGGNPGPNKFLTSDSTGMATWRYPIIRITIPFASGYSAGDQKLRFHLGHFSFCNLVSKIHQSVEYRLHICNLWRDGRGYHIDVRNAHCTVRCYNIHLGRY